MPACNIFLFMLIQCHLSQSLLASCSETAMHGCCCRLHIGLYITPGRRTGTVPAVMGQPDSHVDLGSKIDDYWEVGGCQNGIHVWFRTRVIIHYCLRAGDQTGLSCNSPMYIKLQKLACSHEIIIHYCLKTGDQKHLLILQQPMYVATWDRSMRGRI
jgi:hypothetical protein